jgi:hypothetical protein
MPSPEWMTFATNIKGERLKGKGERLKGKGKIIPNLFPFPLPLFPISAKRRSSATSLQLIFSFSLSKATKRG